MKLRRKLAVAAGALFTLSFFLPAFGELSGVACFGFCWNILTHYGQEHDLSLGGWLYYSGFVLANALFVALLVAILCPAAPTALRRWMSALATLQVISWFFVNLVARWNGDRFNVEIGYFLWLLAYLLLFAAHSVPERAEGHAPGGGELPLGS
ncbi:MAG TPA: hypothetical protein VII43_00200 [Opitutaceae bacterium]